MNEEIEELFPFYALGVLTPEEKARVEAYIRSDPLAKARLDDMRAAAQALPYEASPVPPSGAVKKALMARVKADRAQPAIVPSENWLQTLRRWLASPAFSTAALAGLVLMGVWIANLQAQTNQVVAESRTLQATATALIAENEALQTSLTALQQENNLLRDEILSNQELIALLTDSERQEFTIPGTEFQPHAQATLLVGSEEDTRAVLLVANLPALPADRVYQFWLIGEGGPIGAGLFEANAHGQAVLMVHSDGPILSFEAVGVSIEPSGGSPQPTGNIVLLGNLSEG
ncbi:MAG: hypothetical protein Fur0022_47070 [Anaerolineales bacterium]